MNKKFIKNFILTGVILVATVGMLTGCGKKEEETKTYDKENVEVVSNKNEEITYDKANEAIREALKSKDWLEKNNLYYEFKDGGTTYKSELYFIKIKDIGNMPAYLVKRSIMDSAHTFIVTYKNGEVYVSKVAAGSSDYCEEFVDIENNLVKSLNGSVNYVYIYKIGDGEFERIAEFETEEESYAKYPKANFKEITIKLTNENIDKYVTSTIITSDSTSNETTSNGNVTTVTDTVNSKKYTGEVMTADANTQNPSYANTVYTASVTDNKLNKIVAEVTYKAKDIVIITIDNIDITLEDVAAGTTYVEFKFSGKSQNGVQYTGTGRYSYSNVTDDGMIRLKMNFNEDVFNGVNISTESVNLKVVE